MTEVYTSAWQGARTHPTQALDWPRRGVVFQSAQDMAIDARWVDNPEIFVLNDIVPPGVRDACARLALIASTGPLAPDLTRGVKLQTIGPITTEYDTYSPQSKRYLGVERMIAPYLASRNPFAARLERG